MNTRADKIQTKILLLIAMVGEISSEKIYEFFKSKSYTRKQITLLKNNLLIKNFNNGKETVLRLTRAGKLHIKKYLPKEYGEMIYGTKSVNLLKIENRRIHRRNKLIELLLILHRAGVKIFFDEKKVCEQIGWVNNTDRTDETDLKKTDITECEFYTASEIKFFVPEYKMSVGSRALGILITKEQVYILYSVGDEMVWKQEREIDFQTTTLDIISKSLFGLKAKTSILLFGEEQNALTILERYGNGKTSKITPTYKLSNMIFLTKNLMLDPTLNILTNHHETIEELEMRSMEGIRYDERYPDFNGIVEEKDDITYFMFVFKFDLYKVAKAVFYSTNGFHSVKIVCFKYQEPLLNQYLEKKEHNVKVISLSHEDYIEEEYNDEQTENY